MTLSSYTQNIQYQKTQVQYETKIMPVASQIEELEEHSDDVNNTMINSPIIYTDQTNLSKAEYLQKMILQKILGGFENSNNAVSLFPNENMQVSKESNQNANPYAKDSNILPQQFMYSSSYEYYEKTTIEFNAQAVIKTPNAEYNIEINFSYTQEFYEKNETQIAIANENFKNPFEIELEEDDDSLKELKSLHFIFDIFKDSDKDIFEQVKEALKERKEIMHNLFKNDNKDLDNFKIWQEYEKSEFSLVAAKKDGIGIFLANSSKESSYLSLSSEIKA